MWPRYLFRNSSSFSVLNKNRWLSSISKGACFPGCAYDFDSAHRAANAYEADVDSMYRGIGSGMLYTPLRWSDHCAVDVIIDEPIEFVKLASDARTKACQPFRAVQTVAQLFQQQPNSAPRARDQPNQEPPPPPPAAPVRSLSEPIAKAKGTLLDAFIIRNPPANRRPLAAPLTPRVVGNYDAKDVQAPAHKVAVEDRAAPIVEPPPPPPPPEQPKKMSGVMDRFVTKRERGAK